MPVLSHVHQLFNAEQCQASIHTLRWKDRPLQCPRCQSHLIGRWGTYQYRSGSKRSWCQGCKRTFNDLAKISCTERRGHCRTGYSPPFCFASPVRHSALPESEGSISGPALAGAGGCAMPPCPLRCPRQLEGIVEADDLYPDFDTNRYILTGVRGRGALNCMASWISCLDIWPKILDTYMIQIDLKRPQLLLYFYV